VRTKLILRFYFSVDKLEQSLNNIIMRKACTPSNASADYCSVQIIEIINDKVRLARLWDCLYSFLCKFSQKELNALSLYALMRNGVYQLPEKEYKEVNRLRAKFLRRAKSSVEKMKVELETLYKYSALL